MPLQSVVQNREKVLESASVVGINDFSVSDSSLKSLISQILLSLEREFESYNLKTNFNSKQTDVSVALETIANLERAVYCVTKLVKTNFFHLPFLYPSPRPGLKPRLALAAL